MPNKVFSYGYKELTGKTRQYATEETLDIWSGQFQATRHFFGPWADRFAFIYEEFLRPIYQVDNDNIFGLPALYPDYGAAFATKIGVRGSGKPDSEGEDGQASWDYAFITVEYSSPNFQLGQGTPTEETPIYIEESINFHLEGIILKGDEVLDEETNEPMGDKADISVVIPLADIILKEVFRIRPNWTAIQDCLGCINSLQFVTPSGFACPQHTLRYDGPSGMTKINIFTGRGTFNDTPFPVPVWEISHNFAYNPNRWDRKLTKDGWHRIKLAGGADLFQEKDLRRIFFPA